MLIYRTHYRDDGNVGRITAGLFSTLAELQPNWGAAGPYAVSRTKFMFSLMVTKWIHSGYCRDTNPDLFIQ